MALDTKNRCEVCFQFPELLKLQIEYKRVLYKLCKELRGYRVSREGKGRLMRLPRTVSSGYRLAVTPPRAELLLWYESRANGRVFTCHLGRQRGWPTWAGLRRYSSSESSEILHVCVSSNQFWLLPTFYFFIYIEKRSNQGTQTPPHLWPLTLTISWRCKNELLA